MERFTVIFADDCLSETISVDGHETKCLLLSTANVLASDHDEAIVLASRADFDGHHRPIGALTASSLRAMADALDCCPFTSRRRVTYTTGGYADTERLKHVAASDKNESMFLEV